MKLFTLIALTAAVSSLKVQPKSVNLAQSTNFSTSGESSSDDEKHWNADDDFGLAQVTSESSGESDIEYERDE